MGLPHRQLFRPRIQPVYVAVKHIRIGKRVEISAGTELKRGEYKEWRLRSWYRRGFIGVEGDTWTEWALERFLTRLQREAEAAVEREEAARQENPSALAWDEYNEWYKRTWGALSEAEAEAAPTETPELEAPPKRKRTRKAARKEAAAEE